MASRGGPFERGFSKELSLWFSNGESDDLFWRSAGSGGRATVRRKKGKGTRGHCGDICATDGAGIPLMRMITFELKKGQTQAGMDQVMGRLKRTKVQKFEKWVDQAATASETSKSFAWAIVHRRNRRAAIIYYPHRLMQALVNIGCFKKRPKPFMTIEATIRRKDKTLMSQLICCTTVARFFKEVSPGDIKALAKKFKKGEKLV